MIDKINDKVNRLFTKDKNGYERTFDYFLRTITFFVILIFVLIYASHVHADEDVIVDAGDLQVTTIKSYFGENVFLFDNNSALQSFQNSNLIDIPFYGWLSTGNPRVYYPYDASAFASLFGYDDDLPIVSSGSFTYYGNTYNISLEDYYIYLVPYERVDHTGNFVPNVDGRTYGVIYFKKSDWYFNKNWIYPFDGERVHRVPACTFYVNRNDNKVHVDYYEVYFGDWSKNYMDTIFSSMPLYFSNKSIISNNMENSDINNDQSSDYLLNVNPAMIEGLIGMDGSAILPPDEPEGESNANHLYLKDFNIGLTSADSILNSHIIIKANYDEWQEKFIQDYSLRITYKLTYNGEPWAKDEVGLRDNPVIGEYTETIPLAKLTSFYETEFRTVTNNMNVNNNSATAMFEALQYAGVPVNTGDYVTASDVLDGMSANFKVDSSGAGGGVSANVAVLYGYLNQIINNENHVGEVLIYLTQFDFDITINVIDNKGTPSGDGGKYYNFLLGTSSMNYDILNNSNPWEGSSSDGISNNASGMSNNSINNSTVAYGGSASANGGSSTSNSIGNQNTVNVTTGNGYQDTELHQLTQEDIENNHIKIINTIQALRNVFEEMASTKEEKESFLKMILLEFGDIPGVSIMIASLLVVATVMVIIFIIKIAF